MKSKGLEGKTAGKMTKIQKDSEIQNEKRKNKEEKILFEVQTEFPGREICKLLDSYLNMPIERLLVRIFNAQREMHDGENNHHSTLCSQKGLQFFKRTIGIWLKEVYFPVAMTLCENAEICKHYLMKGKFILDQLKDDDTVLTAIALIKPGIAVDHNGESFSKSDGYGNISFSTTTTTTTTTTEGSTCKERITLTIESDLQNQHQVVDCQQELKEFLFERQMFPYSIGMTEMPKDYLLRELIEEFRVCYKMKNATSLTKAITSQKNMVTLLQQLGYKTTKPRNVSTLKYFTG